MSINQATYDNLARALADLNFPTLSFAQAEQLVEHTHLAKLQSLVAGARVNNEQAREELDLRVIAVRAYYTLLELGFREATLPATMSVMSEQGIDKVRLTVGDAIKGDVNARTIITGWLKNASEPDSTVLDSAVPSQPIRTPAGSGRAPIHPTPIAPPSRTVAVERSARAEPSQSSSRTVNATASAQSATALTEPSPSRPTSQPDNVHQLHAPPVEQRFSNYADDSDTGDQSAPRDVATRDQRQYDQVVVFGRDRNGATALQFDCSPAPAEKGGYLTINLSIARAKGSRTQDGVDWSRKVCVMLSPDECVLCLNVLLGVNREFRGAGHGPTNKKWFQMAESEGDYAGSIFVSLSDGGDQRGCSIMPGALFRTICIFQRAVLDQSRASESNIVPIPLLDILKRVGPMADAASESERARKDKRAARG